ncbi:hypothetical protein REPUB_Repub16aG0071000 [Reevesia pubescens]
MESLPDDLIVEILSRLPADEVLKFRRVCRKWRALTSSRQFIEQNVKHASSILFQQYLHIKLERRLYLEFYFLDEKLKKKMMRRRVCTWFMNGSIDYYPSVVDTCDGLLLLRADNPLISKAFFICNPITQEVLTLMKPYPEGFVFAIFFHSLSKEYRVLYYRLISGNHMEFFIRSLGLSKYWRRLGTFCQQTIPIQSCKIIDKSIYWTALPNSTPCTNSIIAFNMENEEFKALGHPGEECSSSTGQCREHMALSQFERYGLALCFIYSKAMHVWVLKDHEKWSWDKMYEVNLDWDVKGYPLQKRYLTIGSIQNKEILLEDIRGVIYRYNLQRNTFTSLLFPSKYQKQRFYFIKKKTILLNFTKSLVSLKEIWSTKQQDGLIKDN